MVTPQVFLTRAQSHSFVVAVVVNVTCVNWYRVTFFQPNIRRTFPRSAPVKNDDEEDDDNGGPHTYHHPNVGKQFGKNLRPPTNDDDVEEDDDDDDSEEDDEGAKPAAQLAVRRSGKQLAAGAGKYLRP